MVPDKPPYRVLTGAVTASRSRSADELGKAMGDELRNGGYTIVRHVYVKPEVEFLQQLVTSVSLDNEADALLLAGGAGLGRHDVTIEALDQHSYGHIDRFCAAYPHIRPPLTAPPLP